MSEIIIPWINGGYNDESHIDEIQMTHPDIRVKCVRYAYEGLDLLTAQEYPLIITTLKMAPGLSARDPEWKKIMEAAKGTDPVYYIGIGL